LVFSLVSIPNYTPTKAVQGGVAERFQLHAPHAATAHTAPKNTLHAIAHHTTSPPTPHLILERSNLRESSCTLAIDASVGTTKPSFVSVARSLLAILL